MPRKGGPVGRLAQLLGGLDGALAEFETGLGARWRDTVIVVATEFGRPRASTARRDRPRHRHHCLARRRRGERRPPSLDWPGLKPANLYQGRDLAPTTDLRAADEGRAEGSVRAGGQGAGGERVSGQCAVKPMQGLVGWVLTSPRPSAGEVDRSCASGEGQGNAWPSEKTTRIARRLRVNQLGTQRTVLWNRIRNRQIDGNKFARQLRSAARATEFSGSGTTMCRNIEGVLTSLKQNSRIEPLAS